LGWTDREGIIVGDRYKNLRARVNLESKIASFLTVGLNSQFASRDESFLKCDWSQMTMISPYGSNNINDPESIYQRRPTGLDPINPFYDNKYTDRKDMHFNLSNNLYAKVFLPFGIEYQMNYTPNLTWYEYYNHYSSEGESWTATGGQSTRTNSKTFNWQIDNILRWKKEFAKIHKLEVTLLANSEKGQYWSTTANAKNYSPSDILGYHRLQAGAVPTVSSNDTYRTGDALMGRIFYSVKNKYMATTSIRRDGYSAFGKKNPHAVFPSIALGWVFSEEKFLKSADSWLDYGKLRISWGENGNRDIGQYAALSQMSSGLRPYIDQSGTVYTTSQIYVSTMSNYNLKWERTASFNIGLDFSLFKNILSGSLDGYISKTNDLLVSRALPDITGFTSVTSNLGQLQNKGLELTLNANILKLKDLQWTASGNFSMNRRKINKLYGDIVDITDDKGNIIGQKEADDETNGWFIGQDPDRIWAYERTGVWQLDELANAAIYGCQPGDFKYKDQNNDGIMNNKDKVFQGYATPRFRWTLRNEMTYKDFAFSATIYSYWKYYGAFQRAANNYAFPDRTSDYAFPRWTKTNPINDYARIGSKNIGTNWVNRSFIRIENVSLSYNLPKNFLQILSLQALRFSVSIQNAGVWAPDWNFWDPESGSVTPRTFNFGVNLTL
jgi:TonB-linked SusC/RagA family outer membrane protein